MITVLIAVFGGLGAVLRFVTDGTIRTVLGRNFPWGTLIINVTGSFILGLMTGLVLHNEASGNLLLIIGTGFCGGFTTFSTAIFEAVRLIEERRYAAVLVQIMGNGILSLLAAALGLLLTNI